MAPSPGTLNGVELRDEPLDGTNDNHDSGTDNNLGSHDDVPGAQFSAGDECPDPMADSLARALRDAGIGGDWLGNEECPVHEEDEVPDYDDPFHTEGKTNSFPAFPLAKLSPGPNPDTKSSRELMTEWFGEESSEAAWFPYPDKAVSTEYHIKHNPYHLWLVQLFLTDLLFNSPRLRFSRAQQKSILLWASELGANVPSYDRLRKCQTTLKEATGDPTSRQESGRGNVWYLNEIGDAIAKV